MQGLMWRAYDRARLPRILLHRDASRRCIPFYVIRALGGVAVPRRRADHGLQHLEDRERRRAVEPRRRPRRARRRAGVRSTMSLWSKHAIFEKNSIVLVIAC